VDANIVSVGMVDCVIEQALCAEQHVQSYPNIRIYPADTKGVERFELYQNWMRDSHNLFIWLQNYMPTVSIPLDANKFEKMVLKNSDPSQELPWMIDFYAPWCGHCQMFAPTFESLATKFEGTVKFGKVNCQEHQHLCNMIGIRAYPTIQFFKVFTALKSGVIFFLRNSL
jgi:DnaJ family protein C protein 10